MNGYEDFALFYDLLQKDVDYREISELYLSLLKNKGCTSGELIDLACGTGTLSVLFAEAGFNVIGADASETMLSIAMSKAHKGIRYIRQSMEKLNPGVQADAVICALDSINHLPGTGAIKATFNRVYQCLKHGGVFAFDVNTPYKHIKILGDNAFVYDLDDLYAVWQNNLIKGSSLHRVDMTLDFFKRKENGHYIRYQDFLSEIAPEPQTLEGLLKETGFTGIKKCEFPTGKRAGEKSQKLTYCAVKK